MKRLSEAIRLLTDRQVGKTLVVHSLSTPDGRAYSQMSVTGFLQRAILRYQPSFLEHNVLVKWPRSGVVCILVQPTRKTNLDSEPVGRSGNKSPDQDCSPWCTSALVPISIPLGEI